MRQAVVVVVVSLVDLLYLVASKKVANRFEIESSKIQYAVCFSSGLADPALRLSNSHLESIQPSSWIRKRWVALGHTAIWIELSYLRETAPNGRAV